VYARESRTVSSVTKVVSGTKRSASVAEPFRFEGRKASKLVSEVPTRMVIVDDDWVPVV
jgi:hypothetical protein